MTNQPTGALFDIDGTLVDTTYLHALAWRRAFVECGEDVATAAVHRMIGAGSDVLMKELVGRERDDVKDAWRRHFDSLKPDIRAFPRARDLLQALADRGVKVVLASSSEEEDLDALLSAIDAGDAIDEVTSSGDVDQAKPSPEVFQVAMERAGLSAERCIAIGDTVWDVESAGRLDVPCVGVLSGGISRAELESAGAIAVYGDVAELLERLDDSPLAGLLGEGRR